MASVYDVTRVFDQTCFDSALDYLTERFPPSKFPELFEPGIGTGRIAIPLAQRGYRVTGVDIAEEMLQRLAEKLKKVELPLPIKFRRADITKLPFPDATFDIAVVVHVFHLIRDWQKALSEVVRVLRTDAPLVLMFTGNGLEVPFLKQRYRELCAQYGLSAENIGAKDHNEISKFLKNKGRYSEEIKDRWQWVQRVRIDKSLSYVKSRAYSFAYHAGDDLHNKIYAKLERELRAQYKDFTEEIEIPNEISLVLVLAR